MVRIDKTHDKQGTRHRTSPTDTRPQASEVTNVLSFDLEHWYTATLLRDYMNHPVNRLHDSVNIVRDILSDHETKATFFIVGEVAAEYPDLVRQLADDGHEIGTHGHTHTPLSELTPKEFERELSQSADAIDDAIGVRPAGFRAPNFSITTRTRWAFHVLDEADLRYDSSVFPVRTPMYGVSGAPIHPYRVDIDDPFSIHERCDGDELLELPLAMFHPTIRIPMAGGFYARVLPIQVIKRGIQNLNKRNICATLYFHPWEFNPDVRTTTMNIPAHKRFVSFHGIDTLATKLEKLLSSFKFGTVESYLDDYVTIT